MGEKKTILLKGVIKIDLPTSLGVSSKKANSVFVIVSVTSLFILV